MQVSSAGALTQSGASEMCVGGAAGLGEQVDMMRLLNTEERCSVGERIFKRRQGALLYRSSLFAGCQALSGHKVVSF